MSYIVKLFYSAHIQRLIRDTIRFLHMTFSPQSNVPTLYEMLPRQYQRGFDYLHIGWSYTVSLLGILYFMGLVIIGSTVNLIEVKHSILLAYFCLLLAFLILTFVAIKNGNRVLNSLLIERRGNQG